MFLRQIALVFYLVLTSLEIAWAGTCRLIVLKEISSSSENEDVSSDSSSSSEAEDNGLCGLVPDPVSAFSPLVLLPFPVSLLVTSPPMSWMAPFMITLVAEADEPALGEVLYVGEAVDIEAG